MREDAGFVEARLAGRLLAGAGFECDFDGRLAIARELGWFVCGHEYVCVREREREKGMVRVCVCEFAEGTNKRERENTHQERICDYHAKSSSPRAFKVRKGMK